MFKKLVPFALAAFAMASATGAASAQVALGNGVTATPSSSQTAIVGSDAINLGVSASTGWVTQMPLSLSYSSSNVDISFAGVAGIYAGSTGGYSSSWWGNNAYFSVKDTGSVTMDFSATQRYFSAAWGTPDAGNQLQFYNGSNLVASMSGAQYMVGGAKGYAEFSFAETGFTRVVAVNSGGGAFEFANVRFDDVAPAPIPLNAASLGGLMSFLMMLAMRGKGGTQVMVRMAFASIIPRRRVVA